MNNSFYAYFYFGLAGLAFIYFMICIWKEQIHYDEKFKEYMKGDVEEYFEVKYIRKSYFIIIWICFPLGLLCIHALLHNIDSSSINWWGLLLVGISLLTVPSLNYIYKSRQKVIYDHGEIRYCIGDRVKVRGSIYDVDREQSYIYLAVEDSGGISSLISFHSGDKIYFQRESMDCGYKLEALMIKKDLFIDEGAELIAELREEYGEDEKLDELGRLMKVHEDSDK